MKHCRRFVKTNYHPSGTCRMGASRRPPGGARLPAPRPRRREPARLRPLGDAEHQCRQHQRARDDAREPLRRVRPRERWRRGLDPSRAATGTLGGAPRYPWSLPTAARPETRPCPARPRSSPSPASPRRPSPAVAAARSPLPPRAGFGPDPVLPPPQAAMVSTVNIAPATGWAEGQEPPAPQGVPPAALPHRFDPRSSSPAQRRRAGRRDQQAAQGGRGPQGLGHAAGPEGGRRRRPQRQPDHAPARRRRGRQPRDPTVFLEGLFSPFGMALVGDDFYVANADAVVRFPYEEGRPRSPPRASSSPTCRAARSTTTGPRAWSPAPTAPSSTSASARTATWPRTAWRPRSAAPRSSRSTAPPASRVFASGLRNPVGMDWQPQTGALWDRRQRARRARRRPRARLHDLGPGGRLLRLALQLLRPARRRARRAPAPRPGGPGHRPRLRPRRPHRLAGPRLLRRHAFPERYRGGAFVGQHGSWNRIRPAATR